MIVSYHVNYLYSPYTPVHNHTPINNTMHPYSLLFEKLTRYMSISAFLLSTFFKIFFVSTISLVFTFGYFFLLSTFKNIAITQKAQLPGKKRGHLNLSKSIIKVFLSSGMCKTVLAPELLPLLILLCSIIAISSKSVRPCLPSLHRRHFVLSRNSPPQQS